MLEKIEIGKIYKGTCKTYRIPVAIDRGQVIYFFGNSLEEVKTSTATSSMDIEQFNRIHNDIEKEKKTYWIWIVEFDSGRVAISPIFMDKSGIDTSGEKQNCKLIRKTNEIYEV